MMKKALWQLIICLLLGLPFQKGYQFVDLPYDQVLARSLALEGRFAEVKSATQLWGDSFRVREVSLFTVFSYDTGLHVSI